MIVFKPEMTIRQAIDEAKKHLETLSTQLNSLLSDETNHEALVTAESALQSIDIYLNIIWTNQNPELAQEFIENGDFNEDYLVLSDKGNSHD